jgi:hypothetical protein
MRQEVKWVSRSLSTIRRSGQELLGKVKERGKERERGNGEILKDITFWEGARNYTYGF